MPAKSVLVPLSTILACFVRDHYPELVTDQTTALVQGPPGGKMVNFRRYGDGVPLFQGEGARTTPETGTWGLNRPPLGSADYIAWLLEQEQGNNVA